jgi:hypothetical protein
LGASELEFYISVFGTPGTSPWGWRIEGHHLSRHFTVRGEMIGVTPFFLGSYPTETVNNLRAMPREEDAARALVRSLNASQRSQAVFDSRRLTAHATQNAVKVSPLVPIGLEWTAMTPAQQKLLEEIVQTFLKTLPQNLFETHWQKVKSAQTSLRFAWSGAFEPRNPHHYRIQGQGFLLEYDNTRNSGTHIHSVWRDFSADFEALA